MLLYELNALEVQILEQLESEDGIEKELYEKLKLDEEEKILSCARIYRQILSDAQACKEESSRLAERKRKFENNAQKLRNCMLNGMKIAGKAKIRRPEFDISIKKNPPSLQIESEENIPHEYFKNFAPVLDKPLLKDAVKNGVKIEGVQLIQTERIDVK